ncbi:MAG: prepilin-type N-terminal cleavage/methylation domain-containing protein [Symploca sp. SIO2B6]|nr:prepilin-type N-terminal cleavage/methylation domain-containing protein [Symploca sp. SIO2B6]
MLSTLKLIIVSQIKQSRQAGNKGGFTLIELLVAMILAVLVITPLLGFMINFLQTDRREQAKATSAQEIQSALDYIARDLEQAVYIYDADGIERNNDQDADDSGIKDQIPPVAPATGCQEEDTCQPVLVFWKRKLLDKCDVIKGTRVGTLTGGNGNNCGGVRQGNDAAVYSLVTYYLIKDDQNDTWSDAARIGRFEIRGGIPNFNGNNGTQRTEGNQTVRYLLSPSLGFLPPDLDNSINQWTKHPTENYDDAPTGTQVQPQVQILVDYIDQTEQTEDEPFARSCVDSDAIQEQQVPSEPKGAFYACVDSGKNTAQVFIRGNALARVPSDWPLPRNGVPDYDPNKASFFPRGTILIEGRGTLGIQ